MGSGWRIPNTPIAIDTFRFFPGVYIYILTHMHTDHTEGLTPSWNLGIIYCTHVTKAILLDKFKINPEIVVALHEEEMYNIPLESTKQVTMQLTLLDANHCPGSCMLIMEAYFGIILYSGDFRFDPILLENNAIQSRIGKFDALYLDDTFAEPIYNFPTRQEAGEQVLHIISKYPEDYQFLIGIDYLGKEELLVAIALKFQTLIVVSEEKLQMIQAMRKIITDLPDVFTHDSSKGRVIALPKKEVNYHSVMKYRVKRPTIGISPSGWANSATFNNNNSNSNQGHLIYRVGYSLHSSYNELEQFVKAIRPKQLFSISRQDNVYLRSCYGQYCSNVAPVIAPIPHSVKICMEAKKIQLSTSTVVVNRSKKRILQQKTTTRRISQKDLEIKEKYSFVEDRVILDLTDEVNTREVFVIEDEEDRHETTNEVQQTVNLLSDVFQNLQNIALEEGKDPSFPQQNEEMSLSNLFALADEINASLEDETIVIEEVEKDALKSIPKKRKSIEGNPSPKRRRSGDADDMNIIPLPASEKKEDELFSFIDGASDEEEQLDVQSHTSFSFVDEEEKEAEGYLLDELFAQYNPQVVIDES